MSNKISFILNFRCFFKFTKGESFDTVISLKEILVESENDMEEQSDGKIKFLSYCFLKFP